MPLVHRCKRHTKVAKTPRATSSTRQKKRAALKRSTALRRNQQFRKGFYFRQKLVKAFDALDIEDCRVLDAKAIAETLDAVGEDSSPTALEQIFAKVRKDVDAGLRCNEFVAAMEDIPGIVKLVGEESDEADTLWANDGRLYERSRRHNENSTRARNVANAGASGEPAIVSFVSMLRSLKRRKYAMPSSFVSRELQHPSLHFVSCGIVLYRDVDALRQHLGGLRISA